MDLHVENIENFGLFKMQLGRTLDGYDAIILSK